MPMYVLNDPPKNYRINGPQFFLGLAILFAGFYVMFEVNMYGGILMIIVGGLIGNLSRRLPPGYRV